MVPLTCKTSGKTLRAGWPNCMPLDSNCALLTWMRPSSGSEPLAAADLSPPLQERKRIARIRSASDWK